MQSKPNQTNNKNIYIFQTESRKLKLFYSQNHSLLINKRIIFNNSQGTVKYVGPLRHQGKPAGSQDELWVGLVWDQPNRGKHNGTVKDFKYFVCENGNGSLVKFQKIQFGYKLETALFKRYFKAEELHHAKDIYESLKNLKLEMKQKNQEITEEKKNEVITKKIHKIEYDSEAYIDTLNSQKKIMVQFVGFDEIWKKINNLEKLQSISLSDCRICDLGGKGHLSSTLSNLKILSLEDNLISNWNQVFQLGLQLKNLSQLQLTNNKIEPLGYNIEQTKQIAIPQHQDKYQINSANQIFPNLKCFILINTGLTWKSLFEISSSFESTLEELIICKNNLTDTENISIDKIKKMTKLTHLNVQETSITSFDSLKNFSFLESLQKLTLNHNNLQLFPQVSGFASLKQISVQYCNITDPIALYQLSQFTSLQSLNIKHNPIGDRLGNSYVRMRSVAQIEKLNIINGAPLKKYDRKDCEIFYLRQAFREYFAEKKVVDYDYDFKDFLNYCQKKHPNIPKFIKKYGNPFEVQQKKQIKEIIKDEVQQNVIKKGTGMIEILIKNKITQSVDSKKIPLSWTISSIKNFFAKVHKIPVGIQKLEIQIDSNSQPEQITQDHKNLSFYNIKAGSSIILSKKI